MSKNRYTNYNNYSAKPRDFTNRNKDEIELANDNSEKLEEIVNPEINTDEVETVAIPEVKETKEETVEMVNGFVNCPKLNIRKEANIVADIVCVVNESTELMIDMEKSEDEWFKVYTAEGIEGFCMKQFVKIP